MPMPATAARLLLGGAMLEVLQELLVKEGRVGVVCSGPQPPIVVGVAVCPPPHLPIKEIVRLAAQRC